MHPDRIPSNPYPPGVSSVKSQPLTVQQAGHAMIFLYNIGPAACVNILKLYVFQFSTTNPTMLILKSRTFGNLMINHNGHGGYPQSPNFNGIFHDFLPSSYGGPIEKFMETILIVYTYIHIYMFIPAINLINLHLVYFPARFDYWRGNLNHQLTMDT